MLKKTVQEMNLLDDFLFGKMVTYPGIGERFCKRLINEILGVELKHMKIIPQKTYYGTDSDKHGARLDVYIEETEDESNGTLYDIEPDQNDRAELKAVLPQRARFYHAMMDSESLKSGQKYSVLKRVVVIFVMPYDPFGRDHMLYTVQSQCRELPDMPYDDGAKTLFLYTKGTKGEPSKRLKELMCYMEESTEENVCNEALEDIHQMVENVKKDGKVASEYVKIFELEELRLKDEEEKRKEERKKGYDKGYDEATEKGIMAVIDKDIRFSVPINQIIADLQEYFSLNEANARNYIKKYFAAHPECEIMANVKE